MECHTLSFFRGSIGVYKQFTQFEHPQFFVHEPGYKLVALYHGFGIMSNEKGGGFLVSVPYGLGKSDHAYHICMYVCICIYIIIIIYACIYIQICIYI